MRHVLNVLDKIMIGVLIVVLSTMVVVGTMQVLWRYVLEQSLSCSEELMRYLYVWATMLGVGAAIRRKSFACIDSFLDFVGAKSFSVKRIMQVVSFIIQIFVFGLLIIFGTQFMMRGLAQTSPSLPISMACVYAAFPVGGVLGMLYTFEEIYDTFFTKAECSQPSIES